MTKTPFDAVLISVDHELKGGVCQDVAARTVTQAVTGSGEHSTMEFLGWFPRNRLSSGVSISHTLSSLGESSQTAFRLGFQEGQCPRCDCLVLRTV